MEEEVRWIADEMVGRLSRYLRFLGYDVLYARGLADRSILELAVAENRVILTRDVLLAKRGGRQALLVHSQDVEKQLIEVKKAFPRLRETVSFVRCSNCNGSLRSADHSAPEPPRGVPADVWASPVEVHVCTACGQAYWEGSHTRDIRQTLQRLFGQGMRPDTPGDA